MSDETFDPAQLEWMWTKYAEHGWMPIDELKILEGAYDELSRWRKSHASETFNPDWCAASDALKEHLSTRTDQTAEMQAAIVELRAGLHQARAQIEYLHGKFKETGSGNAVIAQCDATLSNTEKWSA